MKNLIFQLIVFLFLASCLVSPAFSQQLRLHNLTSYNELTGNHSNQLSTNPSHADTTKPKKEKTKSWWETVLDFDFWQKLSGPGPLLGLGGKYPVFKHADIFAVFIGVSFSHSIDNRLKYIDYKTVIDSSVIDTITTMDTIITVFSHDSCVQCNKSKAVEMVSLKVNVQYHIPGSSFDLFLGGGLHAFFGETFDSFSRLSGSFGAGWRPPLQCLRVGLMVNVFKRFKPDNFGAVNDPDSDGSIEFIPGAFLSVSLH